MSNTDSRQNVRVMILHPTELFEYILFEEGTLNRLDTEFPPMVK